MDNKFFNVLFIIFVILTGQLSFQDAVKDKVNSTVFDSGIQISDVVFVVLSQSNSYHKNRAELFRKHFEDQLKEVDKENHPKLILTHEEWTFPGTWTIFPLLPELAKRFGEKAWVFICEDETRVNLQKMEKMLRKYDHTKELFLGHALQDSSPTIIHHFAFFDGKVSFFYPDFGSGLLLSNPLFQRLGKSWPDDGFRADFSIDPKHEVAMYIWNDGKGVTLTDVLGLCTDDIKDTCATWYPIKFPECGPPITEDHLFIAVKTCKKFHSDRIPIVKDTWGKKAKNIEYYSDKEDPTIPTVDLGIPNTERASIRNLCSGCPNEDVRIPNRENGHCGKTMAIIKRFYSHPVISKKSWFLIADDDTLINLDRLRKLLACYDPKEPVHLGERYAYGVAKNNWGYNYITGGGGMIFSKEAIRLMVDRGMCDCGAVDSPDDMTLGMRFKHLDISIVHSSYFHQARPDDYSSKFLSARTALSFHKHWNNDPYEVYKGLVQKDIDMDKSHDSNTEKSHDEL